MKIDCKWQRWLGWSMGVAVVLVLFFPWGNPTSEWDFGQLPEARLMETGAMFGDLVLLERILPGEVGVVNVGISDQSVGIVPGLIRGNGLNVANGAVGGTVPPPPQAFGPPVPTEDREDWLEGSLGGGGEDSLGSWGWLAQEVESQSVSAQSEDLPERGRDRGVGFREDRRLSDDALGAGSGSSFQMNRRWYFDE